MTTIDQPSSTSPEVAARNATLIYHPDAVPEPNFTWGSDTDHNPFVFVDEPGTVLTVALENARFATANPIAYLSSESHFHLLGITDQELSLEVLDVPTSYFKPLVISFNVDFDAVHGISSPPFFLVLPPSLSSSASTDLHYSTGDGKFILDGSIDLASLDVLINVLVDSFTMKFDLSSDNSGVEFSSGQPLLGPSWLEPNLVSSTELEVTILSGARRFTSFQFVIKVPTSDGDVKVTSPDPILINATIGDG